VRVVPRDAAPAAPALAVDAARTDMDAVLAFLAAAPAGAAVDIGCGLGAAHPQLLLKQRRAALAAVAGLVPSDEFAALVARAVAALGPVGAPFDAVHLRVETDWPGLCAFWRAREKSPDAAFCGDDVDADALVTRLSAAGVGGPPGAPHRVYVAVDTAALDARGRAVLDALRKRFDVALRADALPGDALPRELGALVDFHVALGAETFVGNSYSTFSGLLILRRRAEGKGAEWW